MEELLKENDTKMMVSRTKIERIFLEKLTQFRHQKKGKKEKRYNNRIKKKRRKILKKGQQGTIENSRF